MADLFAPDSRRPSPEPNPQRKKKRGPRDRGAPVWLGVDLARVQVTYDEYGNATRAQLAAYMLDTGKNAAPVRDEREGLSVARKGTD